MEIYKKGPSFRLILCIGFIFSLFLCSQAKAAWYSTYSDITNTETTTTPYVSGYYCGALYQEFEMPIAGQITKIMVKGMANANANWDTNKLSLATTMWQGTKGGTPYTPSPADHWLLTGSEQLDNSAMKWITFTPSATSTHAGVAATFAKYDIIIINLSAWDQPAGLTCSWNSHAPSTTYSLGDAWHPWGTPNKLDTDYQILYEITPGPADYFTIKSPQNDATIFYDYQTQTPSTTDIWVSCYSVNSRVGVFNSEVDILTADTNDFTDCDDTGNATLQGQNQLGYNTWIIIDENYLTASYNYYRRDLNYRAVSDASQMSYVNFDIIAPPMTGAKGYIRYYEDLYDPDSTGYFDFLFQLALPRKQTSDGGSGGGSWGGSDVTLEITQYDDTSGTGATTVWNETYTDLLELYEYTKIVQIPVTTTPKFYKAVLKDAINDPLDYPTIIFAAYSTTSITSKNAQIPRSTASDTKWGMDNSTQSNWICDTWQTPDFSGNIPETGSDELGLLALMAYKLGDIWSTLISVPDKILYNICVAIVPNPNDQTISLAMKQLKNEATKIVIFSGPSSTQLMAFASSTATTSEFISGFNNLFFMVWFREIGGYILLIFTGFYCFRRLRNYWKN